MKGTTQTKAGGRLMTLVSALIRQIKLTEAMLTRIESESTDAELMESAEYQALLAGVSGMQMTLTRMNQQINKLYR